MLNKQDISHVLRLLPGEDLLSGILRYVNDHTIEAGWLVTGVGSLTGYNIRFANKSKGTHGSGYFEIISLTGTVSVNGCHIHIGVADSNGKTLGGHLLTGCKIYTTAEIVIAESFNYIFTRTEDGTTTSKELQIRRR